MATRMVSLRLDPELVKWADGYAAERGVTRTVLFESALRNLREDSASGVPDLTERVRALRAVEAPGPKTREDYDEALRTRSQLFAGLTAPDSVRGGVEKGKRS